MVDGEFRPIGPTLLKQSPKLLLIAIAWQGWLLGPANPALDSEGGRICHDHESKDTQEHIAPFPESSLCNGFEMKHRLHILVCV